MAQHTFDLIDGLTVGEETHTRVTLRPLTAKDIIDATVEAERPVATPEGWQILASAAMLDVHLVRRQVLSIGAVQGPLTVAELGKLSAVDLSTLRGEAEAMANLAVRTAQEAARRGRDKGGDA